MYTAEDLYTDDVPTDTIEEHENEQQEENNDNEDENESKENEEERTVIKPKRVMNPQPKLNAQLLAGPKGFTSISGYFKNIKYKGKGYEEEDLNTMMKIYEHWCHRLFPKYPFDDCLAKIEQLGNKKAVQVRKNQLPQILKQTLDYFLDTNQKNSNEFA